jgi:hypothetical protein
MNKELIIRLSHQRQGNTALTLAIKKYCDDTLSMKEFIPEFCFQKNIKWHDINEKELLEYIVFKNYNHINIMNNFFILNELEKHFNVIKYSLIRENNLKSALSWVIKFNIDKHKKLYKRDGSDVKLEILRLIREIKTSSYIISKTVPKELQFRYELLYVNDTLNEDYFYNIVNKLNLKIKDTIKFHETPNIKVLKYNDYLKYFDESFLNELENITNFSLKN